MDEMARLHLDLTLEYLEELYSQTVFDRLAPLKVKKLLRYF